MSKRLDTANKLRQKLINVMYLVFIALAFLQLPSDFIDTQKFVEDSLLKTHLVYEKIISENEEKVNEVFNDTTRDLSGIENLHETVTNFVDTCYKTIEFIDYLKVQLINEVDSFGKYNYLKKAKVYTENQSLINYSNNGRLLLSALRTINNKFTEIKSDENLSYFPTTKTVINSKGRIIDWETFFFSKNPNAIAVIHLSKFKLDIQNLILQSYKILEEEFSELLTTDNISIMSGNNIEIYASTNSFYVNEKIDFEISNNSKTDSLNYENIKVVVKESENIYSLKPNVKGKFSFTPYTAGKLNLTILKGNDSLQKNISVKNKPIASINADLGSFYKGIDNPISIISNLNTDQLKIELEKGSIVKRKDKIFIKFDEVGSHSIKIFDKSSQSKPILIADQLVKVNYLPVISVTLQNGKKSGRIGYKVFKLEKELIFSGVSVELEKFYTIKGFTLSKFTDEGVTRIENRSGKFSLALKKLIRESKSGDYFVFDEIQVEGADGIINEVPPLYYKIK